MANANASSNGVPTFRTVVSVPERTQRWTIQNFSRFPPARMMSPSFDAFGSYTASILGCAALSFLGAALAAAMRRHFHAPA